MKETKVNVILHPIRMRIIQNLLNQPLTTQQLKELLTDIPQATLYRNLKKLVEAGVIHIVDEIPIRGTIEKVYSIYDTNSSIPDLEELNNYTKGEHMELFIKFMANLMGEYERYLDQERVDLTADGVSFRQASLYLSNEEFSAFLKELVAVYAKVLPNGPNQGRKRRTLATIIIPEPKNDRGKHT
jgi:DNA-binding transcriptional ArsR family regulator